MEPKKEASLPARNSLSLTVLLGILISFVGALSFWTLKANPPSQPVDPEDSPSDKNENSPADTAFITQVRPAPAQYDSDNRSHDHVPLLRNVIRYTTLLTGFGLLIVNIYQMRATQKAANAAIGANDLTRRLISDTQGAVFQIITDFNHPTLVNPWVGAHLTNAGKVPARNADGVIEFLRSDSKGKIIQSAKKPSHDDTYIPGLGFDEMFPVIPGYRELDEYKLETFKIIAMIDYDDGFGSRRTQHFCRQMEIHPKQGSGWVSCESAKDWTEHPP